MMELMGGSSYTTSVTFVGTPGNAGAYTEIFVTDGTPKLYYCSTHSAMGGNTYSLGTVSGQQGIIRPNEVVTYTASYTISGASAATTFISNIVTVTTSSLAIMEISLILPTMVLMTTEIPQTTQQL